MTIKEEFSGIEINEINLCVHEENESVNRQLCSPQKVDVLFKEEENVPPDINIIKADTTIESNGKKHICSKCGKIFSSSGVLNRHILTVHEKVRHFKCELCESSFYDKKAFRVHKESVHEGKKPFKCDICNKSFAQKGNLNTHISSVHNGRNPIECEICAIDFESKKDLKEHIRFEH